MFQRLNAGDIVETMVHGTRCIGIIISFNKNYPYIANVEWLTGLHGGGSIRINDCNKITR